MKINSNKITDESNAISAGLETIDGQMTFFSHLIDDCARYKGAMAATLKAGELEKQLIAIYSLFHHELEKIKESNNNICEMSKGIDD